MLLLLFLYIEIFAVQTGDHINWLVVLKENKKGGGTGSMGRLGERTPIPAVVVVVAVAEVEVVDIIVIVVVVAVVVMVVVEMLVAAEVFAV